MRCDELLRLLTDYGEGVVDACLCDEIERHLRDCSPCVELRRDLTDLGRLCRESEGTRLPDELRQRIERMLREGDCS